MNTAFLLIKNAMASNPDITNPSDRTTRAKELLDTRATARTQTADALKNTEIKDADALAAYKKKAQSSDTAFRKVKRFVGFDKTDISGKNPVKKVIPRSSAVYDASGDPAKQMKAIDAHIAKRKDNLALKQGEKLHNLSQMKRRKGFLGGLAALGLAGAGGYAATRNQEPAQQNPQVGA